MKENISKTPRKTDSLVFTVFGFELVQNPRFRQVLALLHTDWLNNGLGHSECIGLVFGINLSN